MWVCVDVVHLDHTLFVCVKDHGNSETSQLGFGMGLKLN